MSSGNSSISDLCNYRDLLAEQNGSNYSNVAINQATDCFSKCQRPCRRWQYDIQINRLPISINTAESQRQLKTFRANGLAQIQLIFPNQLDLAVSEQVPTYNFHSFLSNVGGQISLWCGASIVSVVHLMHFIASRICERKVHINM